MNEEIKKAVEVLRLGGTVLYPTDTVWGIGCDATNPEAVRKVYEIKQREDSKSMLVLIDTEARLQQYVSEVPEIAWELLEVTDKPLTIIYPGAKNLAPNLIANDGSVGIRLTNDEFCKRLIQQFKKPIVSTSANISGTATPQIYAEISEGIIGGVDYVINLRHEDTASAQPSSIIKLGAGGQIQILRK